MVIDDLDVIRITLAPDKADAPLFVYPDTVLAFPVVMQPITEMRLLVQPEFFGRVLQPVPVHVGIKWL